ncbi:hypothetical protein F92_00245 [Francisella tularensis subsp. holarctica F92]|nr:hypothetical protein F92_00245 [Francisella tularensis subsp. holarctica F92]
MPTILQDDNARAEITDRDFLAYLELLRICCKRYLYF